jgi:hypothetical protein
MNSQYDLLETFTASLVEVLSHEVLGDSRLTEHQVNLINAFLLGYTLKREADHE